MKHIHNLFNGETMGSQSITKKLRMGIILLAVLITGYSIIQITTPSGNCSETFFNKDYKKAKKICSSQLKNGNPLAGLIMGTMFMDGNGGERSYEKAEKFFTDAVQSPDVTTKIKATAEHELGVLFRKRDFIRYNIIESTRWFKKSADHGYRKAQLMYGSLLALGKGVEKNFTQAKLYLHKSLDQGLDKAQITLDFIQEIEAKQREHVKKNQ